MLDLFYFSFGGNISVGGWKFLLFFKKFNLINLLLCLTITDIYFVEFTQFYCIKWFNKQIKSLKGPRQDLSTKRLCHFVEGGGWLRVGCTNNRCSPRSCRVWLGGERVSERISRCSSFTTPLNLVKTTNIFKGTLRVVGGGWSPPPPPHTRTILGHEAPQTVNANQTVTDFSATS